MNIVVTGGAGFIGSHLVDQLIQEDHRVLVIDNLSTGVDSFVNKKAIFQHMDIRDSAIEKIFQDFQPEYVFHLAAQTMVPVSMDNPRMDCDVNLMGLINILEACHKVGVKKILMPSSAAVYGDLETLPLVETEVGVPTSFYGLTKLTTEGYLRIFSQYYNLPYVCYRYANVYGPRQGRGGEGGVISIFVDHIANDQDITVFGDGEQTRDFVYVADVVNATLAGMREGVTGIYNVSTNTGTSVNQLIQHLQIAAGKEVTVHYQPARLGDIKHSRLDNTKAQQELYVEPKMELLQGLANTYQYFVAHKDD